MQVAQSSATVNRCLAWMNTLLRCVGKHLSVIITQISVHSTALGTRCVQDSYMLKCLRIASVIGAGSVTLTFWLYYCRRFVSCTSVCKSLILQCNIPNDSVHCGHKGMHTVRNNIEAELSTQTVLSSPHHYTNSTRLDHWLDHWDRLDPWIHAVDARFWPIHLAEEIEIYQISSCFSHL